jgi:outer membrane protein insertion porin family
MHRSLSSVLVCASRAASGQNPKMNLQALTRRIASALPLAGITLTAAPAHAASPFMVQDIRIEGLKRIEPGTLFAYLPIKQGSTFNDDKASEAIRALYATGFFNDVRISAEGTTVIVQVQERPAAGTIDFAGTHEFDKDNLTKES